jgi:cytochrome c-type biogenesis protein CcmE
VPPGDGPSGVKPRTKFLLGFLLVAGSAGYLMASSIRETGMYYFTPSELAAKVAADPGFRNVGIKVGARVVPGSIVRDASGRQVQFLATDGAKTYPVIHRGTVPDTFSDSADVIVEGRLDAAGTFQATTLLAKCASRFEAAPDKYRDTPGYQAAAPKRTS